MNAPNKIITHHAVSQPAHTTQDVDSWHKSRWPGFTSKQFRNKKGEFYHVGYHFVIEWDGTLVQTRGLSEEGAHCIGQNTSSIGVCFMGNFDTHFPSPQQLDTWKKLYTHLTNELEIPLQCYPHRAYANKSCHGALLTDDYFTRKVEQQYRIKLKERILMLITQLRALITNKRIK